MCSFHVHFAHHSGAASLPMIPTKAPLVRQCRPDHHHGRNWRLTRVTHLPGVTQLGSEVRTQFPGLCHYLLGTFLLANGGTEGTELERRDLLWVHQIQSLSSPVSSGLL